MADCLFCKIIGGEISCGKLYEDSEMLAFKDIDPKAPVHFLVIPKAHISGMNKITAANCDVVGKIFAKIPEIAAEQGWGDDFRVVSNCGKLAGQTVEHLHFHVLAGRELGWPPG